MIKKTYLKDCKKWLISGFKDETQKKNIVLEGFQNKIWKIFNTEQEANKYKRSLK